MAKAERLAHDRLTRDLRTLHDAAACLSARCWDLLDAVQELEWCCERGTPPSAALLREIADAAARYRAELADVPATRIAGEGVR